LEGGNGDDVYRFGRGSGNDIIFNAADDYTTAVDTVEFGAGITPDDLGLLKEDDDLRIRIKETGDSLVVRYGSSEGLYKIDQFKFADGMTLSAAEFEARGVAIYAHNHYGAYLDLHGTSVDDRLYGSGSEYETLYGDAGNDTLYAGDANGTLNGGLGNDTYFFSKGSSGMHRIINTVADNATTTDTVEFGAGIAVTDLELLRIYDAFCIRIKGTSESLIFDSSFSNEIAMVDQFRFADGTVLTAVELVARGYGVFAYDGNDTYTVSKGSGESTIYNYTPDYAAGTSTVLFDADITEADLALVKDGDDLRINIAGLTDSLLSTNGSPATPSRSISLELPRFRG
jgi:Ca2+-binding RTX toxin-like protein